MKSLIKYVYNTLFPESTFLHARAVHEEFNADLMLPATIITVCDTPHNQGYGTSAASVGKLASQFLQSLALSVILNLPVADFTTPLDSFKRAAAIRQLQTNGQAASKFSKSWNTLASFVDKLELVQKQDIPPLVLGTYLDFGSLAILAGITASASNQRIKEDVWNHLRHLYSH